jgi:PelA/Pel-15E family pectate lyase
MSRVAISILVAAGALLSCAGAKTPSPPVAPTTKEASEPKAAPSSATPISIDGFADGIKHYQNANDRRDYARLDPRDARALAENILLYQRQNGGFPPNWDPLRVLSDAEKAAITAEAAAEDTSFDNRGTYPQIEYLAEAFRQTGDARFRDASLRGLGFVLAAQYENGGFPHSFPSRKEYQPHITFMDDVMPGVLTLLRRMSDRKLPFDFVPEELRAQAADARLRGDRCVLALQVKVQGVPTVWAGQYDERTLAPTLGRSYELPSLVSDESVSVVEYLMRIEAPDEGIVSAITAAVAWFERSKIQGIRLERFAAEPVRYKYHSSTEDVRFVADPAAPPLWARFYEIETNRPFMANRDGNKVYSLAEVDRERRTGYRWYGNFAERLLSRDYPDWRRRLGRP